MKLFLVYKKIIFSTIIVLSTLTLASCLPFFPPYVPRGKMDDQNVLKFINPTELPAAKLGKFYQQKIKFRNSSLVMDLEVTPSDMGINVKSAEGEEPCLYNIELNNSCIEFFIEGVPKKMGEIKIRMSVIAGGGYRLQQYFKKTYILKVEK